MELFKQSNFTPESVMKLQRRDSSLIPIIAYLEQGDLPKLQRDARRLILRCADYHLCNSLLFHSRNAKCKRTENFKSKYQLVLPRILIQPVLELYHDSPMTGHGGIQSTTDIISEYFYFEKLPSIVSNYVQSCHACQTRKMTKAHTKSDIISYRTPTEPFQVWQVDLFGPLPTTQRTNRYIFSAVDMFSKLVFNMPIANCDVMTVSQALFEMVCQYGVCDTIISDRGSEFISSCTGELCKLLGIKQNFTPSFIHHCLGACERAHRTLAECLTPYVQNGKQWDAILPAVTFAMDSSVHSSIKYSPYEVLYGFRLKFPLSVLSHQTDFNTLPADFHTFIETHTQKISEIRADIEKNAIIAGNNMTERVNRKSNPLKTAVGDYVYMLKEPVGVGRKLQPKYSGPLVVHEIISPHTVKVRDPSSGKILKIPAHLDKFKVAYVRAPQPADYFLPSHTQTTLTQDTGNTETSSSEETKQVNVPPTPQLLRRSNRVRVPPKRYQEYSIYNTDSISEEPEEYYKVKWVLAQRKNNGMDEYFIQFKGEPAQNAQWIPFNQLNEYTQNMIHRKLPPSI